MNPPYSIFLLILFQILLYSITTEITYKLINRLKIKKYRPKLYKKKLTLKLSNNKNPKINNFEVL